MTNLPIVLVEDDTDIRDLISFHFLREGFQVTAFPDGTSLLNRIKELATPPVLILLDIMLPGKSGLDLCRELKGDPHLRKIPVVMISARGSEADVVVGLELGADDYVVKPFSIREVVARARAVVRRYGVEKISAEADIEKLGIVLQPEQYQVFVKGQEVKFTLTEFNLLKSLMARPGQVLTRNQLIDSVLGANVSVVDRTIDVHVVSIRRKLGDLGNMLETVRGVGYRFVIPTAEASAVKVPNIDSAAVF